MNGRNNKIKYNKNKMNKFLYINDPIFITIYNNYYGPEYKRINDINFNNFNIFHLHIKYKINFINYCLKIKVTKFLLNILIDFNFRKDDLKYIDQKLLLQNDILLIKNIIKTFNININDILQNGFKYKNNTIEMIKYCIANNEINKFNYLIEQLNLSKQDFTLHSIMSVAIVNNKNKILKKIIKYYGFDKLDIFYRSLKKNKMHYGICFNGTILIDCIKYNIKIFKYFIKKYEIYMGEICKCLKEINVDYKLLKYIISKIDIYDQCCIQTLINCVLSNITLYNGAMKILVLLINKYKNIFANYNSYDIMLLIEQIVTYSLKYDNKKIYSDVLFVIKKIFSINLSPADIYMYCRINNLLHNIFLKIKIYEHDLYINIILKKIILHIIIRLNIFEIDYKKKIVNFNKDYKIFYFHLAYVEPICIGIYFEYKCGYDIIFNTICNSKFKKLKF